MANTNTLGVELLPKSIKFVELSSAGELVKAESFPVLDSSELAASLLEALQALYGKLKKAPPMSLSFPAKSLFIQNFSIPLDSNQPLDFLKWEIGVNMGGSPNDYSVVYSVETPDGAEAFRSAHAIAVRKHEIEDFYASLVESGISPQVIDSEIIATLNAVQFTNPIFTGGVLKLDENRSFFIEMRDGQFKKMIALPDAEKENQDSLGELQATIVEMVETSEVSEIYLTGELSTHFCEKKAPTLGVSKEMHLLDPLVGLPVSGKMLLDEETSPTYAAAYALAKGIED